jgi:hypothetical protein
MKIAGGRHYHVIYSTLKKLLSLTPFYSTKGLAVFFGYFLLIVTNYLINVAEHHDLAFRVMQSHKSTLDFEALKRT